MKNRKTLLAVLAGLALSSCTTRVTTENDASLKGVLGDKFLVGVALNTRQSSGVDTAAVKIVKRHFNSVVAENCMKCQTIHPEEDRYDFSQADEFVKFGEDNGMYIIGHCLVWHSQLAPWFCVDKDGNNVAPEVLKQRLKDHITTIVSRYKGRVKGWDVVNEAILEDGSYRKSKFYEILGEEFIPLAFQYAHEADPEAELYYNDYNMHEAGKRATVVKLSIELEAVANRKKGFNGAKSQYDYENNLYEVFKNAYRVLKPMRYLSLTFNNKDICSWLALLFSILKSGFTFDRMYFQDGVKNYRQTAHTKAKGSPYGDFIYTFKKVDSIPVKVYTTEEDFIYDIDNIFLKDISCSDENRNEMILQMFVDAIPLIDAFAKTKIG